MDLSFSQPRVSTMTAPLIGSMYAKTRSFLAFVWLGLGSLLPMYFFATADPYYRCKFENFTVRNSSVPLGTIYANTVIFCSSLTNVLTIALVTFICIPYLYKKRIYISFIGISLCLITSLIIACLSSDSWLFVAFILTMIIVMIQNVFGAILLNCFFSLASTLPSRYIQGFGIGQALAGTFVSICSIISMSSFEQIDKAIIAYFVVVIFVVISNIIVYYYLDKTHLFQIYSSAAQEINNEYEPFINESSNTDENQLMHGESISKRQRFQITFKQIKWNFWGVFCTSVVTFSLFPGYLSKIESTHPHDDEWATKLFVPVMGFLLFFLGDILGRVITIKFHRPSYKSPRLLFLICSFRIVFIFLFGFCKHPGTNHYPQIIHHDAIYGLFILLFSISHGYCHTLNFMYAPLRVQTEFTGTVGALMTLGLAGGLFVGSLLSYLIVYLYGAYHSQVKHCQG